jgi:phospholipid-binding lipoprotein MlaA
MLLMAMGGCASQSVTIRRLPPETPAANNAADIVKAQGLAVAAAMAAKQQTPADAADAAKSAEPAAAEPVPPVTAADAPSMDTYDPWARLNRFTYRFNARFDEAIFLPVANGYRRLPAPLRSGVHNFFGNLSEFDSVINYTLQGRLGRGVRSLERLVINSTIGIGGLFDVATKLHLPGAPTGFGTTLAKWGMHPGPYLIVPLLGPSTLREGIGLAADYGTSYAIDIADLYRGDLSYGLSTLYVIDQRANVDFRYYATGSPFEYATIRFLYVRKLLIEDEGLHRKRPPTQRNPSVPAGQ